jgi:uncharacterized protein YxeA
MNKHSGLGFVSLVFILITVLATTVVTGAGYGIYKYQQTSRENQILKEEAEAQKDQQIEALQEKLETVTNQGEENQSTSTVGANEPTTRNEAPTESYYALVEQQNITAQKLREELGQQQKVANDAEASLLLSETCKAQRDARKTKLWNAMLIAVDLAGQQKEGAKLDSLMSTISPGSMSATSVFNLAKTSDEEHEENLSIAETQMESTLAEFYEDCLQGE